MKTNGISLGPDGFNAVRNANLLSLVLDFQEIEAKKQSLCQENNDDKKPLTCLFFGVQHEFIHCFVIC